MASGGDDARALSEALLDAPAEDAAPQPAAAPRRRSRCRTCLRAFALLFAAAALGFAVFMMVLSDSLSRSFGGNGWHDWFRRHPRLA